MVWSFGSAGHCFRMQGCASWGYAPRSPQAVTGFKMQRPRFLASFEDKSEGPSQLQSPLQYSFATTLGVSVPRNSSCLPYLIASVFASYVLSQKIICMQNLVSESASKEPSLWHYLICLLSKGCHHRTSLCVCLGFCCLFLFVPPKLLKKSWQIQNKCPNYMYNLMNFQKLSAVIL